MQLTVVHFAKTGTRIYTGPAAHKWLAHPDCLVNPEFPKGAKVSEWVKDGSKIIVKSQPKSFKNKLHVQSIALGLVIGLAVGFAAGSLLF